MTATSLAPQLLPPRKLHSRPSIHHNLSPSIPVVRFSKLQTFLLFPCQCKFRPVRGIFAVRSSKLPSENSNVERDSRNLEFEADFNVEEVRSPVFPANVPSPSLSLSDQAFFLLSFIACTTAAAMVGFVAAAVPAMFAMRRSAIALSKLADELRKEMPGTMAAVRVTGVEISDLILELSELSQEISDGVSKSAQVVQAADAGIRQIGSLARERTISMVEERANLPEISLQPVVVGAAKKTSRAVGNATRTLLNIISRRELISDMEDSSTEDEFEA